MKILSNIDITKIKRVARGSASKEPLYIGDFINLDHPYWKAETEKSVREAKRMMKSGAKPYKSSGYVRVLDV